MCMLTVLQPNKGEVPCPVQVQGPSTVTMIYDFCSEDFVKGELHSKLRGVLSQEEAEEATR